MKNKIPNKIYYYADKAYDSLGEIFKDIIANRVKVNILGLKYQKIDNKTAGFHYRSGSNYIKYPKEEFYKIENPEISGCIGIHIYDNRIVYSQHRFTLKNSRYH
jgi:hypothetical protein